MLRHIFCSHLDLHIYFRIYCIFVLLLLQITYVLTMGMQKWSFFFVGLGYFFKPELYFAEVDSNVKELQCRIAKRAAGKRNNNTKLRLNHLQADLFGPLYLKKNKNLIGQ